MGDLKRKLVREMSLTLQSKIACITDIACDAGLEGLRQVSLRVADIHENRRLYNQEQTVGRFLEVVGETDMHVAPLVCYGEKQVVAAMRLGAAKHLLIASDVFHRRS